MKKVLINKEKLKMSRFGKLVSLIKTKVKLKSKSKKNKILILDKARLVFIWRSYKKMLSKKVLELTLKIRKKVEKKSIKYKKICKKKLIWLKTKIKY